MAENRCMNPSAGKDVLDEEAHKRYSSVFTNAKAGMQNVDKEKVKKVVYDISKDSSHFQNEQRKQDKVQQRIEKMRVIQEGLTAADLARREKELAPQIATLEANRELDQIWMHVDMDAFFAACEERDNPELASVPVAIGGMSMISTANYEARKYGVRAAMPGFIAVKLCPHLKFIDVNFPKYEAAAATAREVFARFDPNYCSRGLDEASLCVTEYCCTSGLTPAEVAERIRAEVKEETRLTCSVGIAPNTMLAKIGSDINKPNGQHEVPRTRPAVMDFINDLSVRKVPGIGRVSEQLLSAFGVNSVGDLQQKCCMISYLFSPISFDYFLHVSLGLGSTKHFAQEDDERKSVSCERTFAGTGSKQEMEAKIQDMADKLHGELSELKLTGRCICLKLKQVDFRIKQRSVTLPTFINSAEGISAAAKQLLQPELPIKLRLLGVRVSNLQQASHALPGSLETFLRKGLKSGTVSNTLQAGENLPRDLHGSMCDMAARSESCRQDAQMQRGDSGTCSLANCEDTPAPVPHDREQSSSPNIGADMLAREGFEVCTECGAQIPSSTKQEHSDMHVAQRLSATVNGAGYIEGNSGHRSLGSVEKRPGTQQRVGSKRGPESGKKKKAARPCTSGALDRLLKK